MTSQAPAASFGKTALKGSFWTYAAFFSGRLLTFITTIILARILGQEDFGIAAYALVVINFLDVLNEFGVGPALIYHRKLQGAPDTAFWIGMGTSTTLFAATWLAAPLIGVYFNDPRAVGVTQALALTFPISALGSVHDALLRKELAFGKRFAPLLIQSVGKGLVSIVLAVAGFGAWSLIWGQVIGTLIGVIAFWWVYPWRPSFSFGTDVAGKLLSYGSSTVLLNLIAAMVLNIDYLLVGRFLGATALGVYMLAFRIPQLLILQICDPISKVVFPMFAKIQDDPDALQKAFVTTMRYVSLVTIPLGSMVAALSEPFVLFVYGQEWAEAIGVMRAITLYAVLLSLTYNAGDVYKAQGRMMLMTKISLLRLGLMLPAIWLALTTVGTIEAVAWVQAAIAGLIVLINLGVAVRTLHVSPLRFFTAMRTALVAGALMYLAAAGSLLLAAGLPHFVQLIVGAAAGGAVYLAVLWWLQRDLIIRALTSARNIVVRRLPSQTQHA
jgi:O-antigen/teichoic acid export membrane protein